MKVTTSEKVELERLVARLKGGTGYGSGTGTGYGTVLGTGMGTGIRTGAGVYESEEDMEGDSFSKGVTSLGDTSGRTRTTVSLPIVPLQVNAGKSIYIPCLPNILLTYISLCQSVR